MSTYAYMNLAGSCGKTATVTATACTLANQGLTVEIMDFDLQGGASTVFGYPYYTGLTVADVVRGNASIGDVVVPARLHLGTDPETDEEVFEEIPRITIVPTARSALKPLVVEIPAVGGGYHRLRKALVLDADQRSDKQPDVRLIDCGGVASPLLTAAALATTAEDDERTGAHGVITCAKPAGKEIEGVPDLLDELKERSEEFNRAIELVSIVPCMIPVQGGPMGQVEKDSRQYQFRVNSGYRDMLAAVEETYDAALTGGVTPPVRRTNEVDHAYTARTPLPYYKPAQTRAIMEDYAAVVAYQQKRGLFVPRCAGQGC